MKSSTIRRSNLSKEKIAVLEALAKYKNDSQDNTPNVYLRNNKEKELDLLWQNFKINQKSEKSPVVYLVMGFAGGIAAALFVGAIIGLSIHSASNAAKVQQATLNLVPASEKTAVTSNEIYTVQSGDTMESILTRFYGSYSQEHAWAVMKASNIKNPNKLSIGQKLTIPMSH